MIPIHGEDAIDDEAIVTSRDPAVIARAIDSLPAQLGQGSGSPCSAYYDPRAERWT